MCGKCGTLTPLQIIDLIANGSTEEEAFQAIVDYGMECYDQGFTVAMSIKQEN